MNTERTKGDTNRFARGTRQHHSELSNALYKTMIIPTTRYKRPETNGSLIRTMFVAGTLFIAGSVLDYVNAVDMSTHYEEVCKDTRGVVERPPISYDCDLQSRITFNK